MAAGTTADTRRVMKMIDVYSLEVIDLATLSYILDELTIGGLKTKHADHHDKATEVICKPNDNPNDLFEQLDNYCKSITGCVRVGLKCDDLSFYYQSDSSKGDEASTSRN